MKNTGVHGDIDILINKHTKICHVYEKNIVAIVKQIRSWRKKKEMFKGTLKNYIFLCWLALLWN